MSQRKRTGIRIMLVVLLVAVFCIDVYYDCYYSSATEITEGIDETSEIIIEEQKSVEVNESQQEDLDLQEEIADEVEKDDVLDELSLEENFETKMENSSRSIASEYNENTESTAVGSGEYTTENGAYKLFYYTYSDGTASIHYGYDLKEGDLIIPQYINGYEVVGIDERAFETQINEYRRGGQIRIPSSVKWIGDRAFSDCNRLTGNLIIPDSVEYIGTEAFYRCTGLKGLTLSNSLTEIKESAFCGCRSIEGRLVIPEGITIIESGAFANCESISEVEFSSTVCEIGDEAFYECFSLESVEFNKGIEIIGKQAFFECDLYNLTIPSTCKEIKDKAFEGTLVNNLCLEEGIERIGAGAFCECNQLKGLVVIPKSVIEIGEDVFKENHAIQAIRNETDIRIVLPQGKNYKWINQSTGEYVTEVGKDTVYKSDNKKFGYVSYENKWEYYDFDDLGTNNLWNYGFKSKNSIPYNETIAKASIRVAMSAFGTGTVKETNIKDTMEKMGFKDFVADYPVPSGVSIGSAISHSEMDSSTSVILVAIRGGGYEAEWASNFEVKSKDEYEPDHAGFSSAANQVVERLNSYIATNEDNLNDNIILWFTGYSRGGAVANIAAARALDGKVVRKGKAITTYLKDNVYAYCFECPKTTRVAFSVACQTFNYGGIYNIINPVDPVPQLPMGNMKEWSFRRYGTTYIIPSKLCEYSDFETYNNAMKAEYAKILSNHIVVNEDMNNRVNTLTRFSGFSLPYINNYGMFVYNDEKQEDNIWNIISSLSGLIESPEAFYEETPSIDILKERGDTWQIAVQNVVGEKLGEKQTIIQNDKEKNDYKKEVLLKAHYPELCLAWMDSVSTYELSKRKMFNGIVINCPVDVEVYDDSGKLIEQIIDDEPQVIDEEIVADVDENGQKIVYVPGQGKYYVVLKPTDEGTMTVSIMSIGMAEMSVDQLNVFEDVPIQTGCDYTLTVDNSQSSYSSKYVLKDENDITVTKRKYFDSSRIKWYTVDVISEGNGEIQGGGSFLLGEYAKVIAIPNEKGQFEGWYINGECVSTELEYRFAVKANVEIKAVFGEAKPQIRAEIANDVSYTYTGKEIRPEVCVYYGDELLHANTDYTVSYINNVHVSNPSDGDNSPKIIVEGNGEYEGSSQLSFTILPCDISGSDFHADDISVKATGDILAFNTTLYWNGSVLDDGDYIVEYYYADENGHAFGERIDNIKDVGDYILRFTGRRDFAGNKDIRITVTENLRSLDDVSISEIPDQQYTGLEIIPSITITDGDYTLILSHDFEISVTNNIEVGAATITVNGLGDYEGQRKVSFNIVGRSINSAIVEGISKYVPYGGANTTINGIKLYYDQNATRYDLVEGRDYSVFYTNNNKIGTATLTINGINGYIGSIKKTFNIVPYYVSGASDNNLSVSLDSEEVEYSKCGAEPVVTVSFNCSDGSKVILKNGIDYVTLCCNNKKVNDRSNPRNVPILKICLRGNYCGTITRTYSITPKNISGFRVFAENRTYQNKKNIYKTNIAVIDEHGMILSPYSDYIKDIEYRYKEDTWVISNKKKELRLAESVVRKDDIIPADTVIRVIVKAKEKGNYTGEATGEYKITKNNIVSASISITKQTYTGKPITIDEDDIKVKMNGETLVYGVDYEIDNWNYCNNINTGVATVTVRGIGNYTGCKNATYRIRNNKTTWGWSVWH